MLSYQHAYHAGNFADVHKHLTLFAVTGFLLRKASPITYIDTHAGRGLYPLSAAESQKLQEHRQGAERLWQERQALAADPLLGDWLSLLAEAQLTAGKQASLTLDCYPGSPWWLSRRLRAVDRLTLFELHPGEHEHLAGQRLPSNVKHIHGDGLKGLLQRLPVATPRLCVLIDPSYERKSEYAEVAETVLSAMRKARHGVVLVWYPLLPAGRHSELLEGLRSGGLRKIWRSELTLREPSSEERGMYGSGMLVINPPWGLEEQLVTAMKRIEPLLGPDARHRGEWWVAE
ncbi:23S rRNA (adenine(2030)-N(6))-methyltransferase RlmJ [Billgrantia montanilacus]|uniref:Ribosomal RNA large subunit methyltransferase J n=1 Tax=Billgrantia montanilacus TaxID=2282305 RepID=A0A368U0J7_9GAMM|nr:23S rRNA (adenine(2030)-N(6))-methyltransferase RlmJ [Halomonas montanilacus]RCV90620.1 23S rRNA (adenine(2030)-N(6))-methyltransferase RlmJ [Halomonas montanilacus]